MLILARDRAKSADRGYAKTFLVQLEECLGTALDRGVRIVANAGGLNPGGLAQAVRALADRLGLSVQVAHVEGDNLLPRAKELGLGAAAVATSGGGTPLAANAYLGAWGIVDCLNSGADVVVTGRVTDASVIVGPAAAHHGWSRTDYDRLAGAIAAGHVIECGAQATGGNYSFFHEIEGRNDVGGRARFGFPWAEVAADGSCVIGKHEGTGGVVNVETVTSQLLYEIGGPEYLGPDVTARFDTIEVEQIAPDRVRVFGVMGQAPPATLKVAMNELGGFRNSFTVALTGLDVEEKAAFAQAAFWDACPYGPDDFASIESRVIHTNKTDPATQEEATALWRVTVKDPDERKVGRAFADAMVHTALAGIPGMYGLSGGPGGASPFGVYRPATVPSDLVPQYVHVNGTTTQIDSVAPTGLLGSGPERPAGLLGSGPERPEVLVGELGEVPLGAFVGTRSGDKGGDANLGVYARGDAGWAWLDHELTVDRLRELLPETADMTIDRYRYPNLRALNFVIRGLLQEGVAASTRQDAQAKAVGEWLRARVVAVPNAVLD
jgi:hypothetical protein